MMPKDCKRLAEVDFPLASVNEACARENNIKTRVESRHVSLLHSWWARRPLACCRAVLLSLLLPDPCDPHCPESFRARSRKILKSFRRVGRSNEDLRKALLIYISEVCDYELVNHGAYASSARQLIEATGEPVPHVFDPFAGGGSIPLESARLGAETTAGELNPVAWLILRVMLEWSARKGDALLDAFEEWSEWVLEGVDRRLSPYYPRGPRNRLPLAYLWARTVRCEAPGCGATIPLIRNLALSEARSRRKALRITYPNGSKEPRIQVFTPKGANEVGRGTVARFKATCPKCNRSTPRERVQAQLRARHGGADDALLLAVVGQNHSGRGKDYYEPTEEDRRAFDRAAAGARKHPLELPPFPQNDTRAFPPGPYGITTWADALAPRQRFSRWVIHQVIEEALDRAAAKIQDPELVNALAACLYLAYSDNAQYQTSLCVWLSEGVTSIFIQGSGVPMRADFVEGSPLSPNCEGLAYAMRSVRSALHGLRAARHVPCPPLLANALDPLLPDESVDVVFTDPPYANQIPYAHLSDFFYGWLKLGLASRFPEAFGRPVTEKAREITENRAVSDGGVHDREWYEARMREAFVRLQRTMREEGVAGVVFAHKETDRWEALVSALVSAGWRTTGSWPIATERKQRMRGQGYAALETSVHLVCRPRPEEAGIGDWAQVLRELPRRVGDWMERLQAEGIRGADLVFACIGPGLEVFSRYGRVETAEGREVGLAEFLEKIWEVVGRSALAQVLGAGESGAGALEEDARLTALFLWTLQSTNGAAAGNGEREAAGDEKDAEDEDDETPGKKPKGLSLPFDVVRRFSQPLGIRLPDWEGRVIETKKGVVRLLPVAERSTQLFGANGAEAAAARLEERATSSAQQLVFTELA